MSSDMPFIVSDSELPPLLYYGYRWALWIGGTWGPSRAAVCLVTG